MKQPRRGPHQQCNSNKANNHRLSVLCKHGFGRWVIATDNDAGIDQQRASRAHLCIEHPLYRIAGELDLELAFERPHSPGDTDEPLSVNALHKVVVGVQQVDRQAFFLL